MKLKQIPVIIIILISFNGALIRITANVLYEWKELEFSFDNENTKNDALNSGQYIPGSALPIDLDVDTRGRVFLTIPRLKDGVPFSLGTLKSHWNKSPKIEAYPDYAMHTSGKPGDCYGITSVFRIAIDECNRIWILDAGLINLMPACDPQLFIYDLENDEIIRQFVFPKDQLQENFLLVTIIVDVRDTCDDTIAYIANDEGSAIIVYDYSRNTSWSIKNEIFAPEPNENIFTIAGVSFTQAHGVLGLSVSPKSEAERYLFFHSLAGVQEHRVLLTYLDNETYWESNNDHVDGIFQTIAVRNTQSSGEAIDSKGILYFGLMTDLAIGSLDTTGSIPATCTIFKQDSKNLQYVSGIKVKEHWGCEHLWALSNRYQTFATNIQNTDEINYRILKYWLC